MSDASKLSLSFYGKRPGPGMKLDKQHFLGPLERVGELRAAQTGRHDHAHPPAAAGTPSRRRIR